MYFWFPHLGHDSHAHQQEKSLEEYRWGVATASEGCPDVLGGSGTPRCTSLMQCPFRWWQFWGIVEWLMVNWWLTIGVATMFLFNNAWGWLLIDQIFGQRCPQVMAMENNMVSRNVTVVLMFPTNILLRLWDLMAGLPAWGVSKRCHAFYSGVVNLHRRMLGMFELAFQCIYILWLSW